jgi:nucleotidyltransferase substrate binding protein (TIGR01987 family)
MSLQLDSLKKAVDSLQRSVKITKAEMPDLHPDLQETLRAGVIQNFEVAYEQSWKMIQRWIKENQSSEEAENPRTRKDLFRLAARLGLIEDPLPWFEYGESRNLTAHTYDQDKAEEAFRIATVFLSDAKYLLSQLEQLND